MSNGAVLTGGDATNFFWHSFFSVVVRAQLRGVATIQSWVQVYLGAETERRIYELKGVGTEKQMAKAHTSYSKKSHRRCAMRAQQQLLWNEGQ